MFVSRIEDFTLILYRGQGVAGPFWFNVSDTFSDFVKNDDIPSTDELDIFIFEYELKTGMKPNNFNEGCDYKSLYIKTDDFGYVKFAIYKKKTKAIFTDGHFIIKTDVKNKLNQFIDGQEITDELLDIFIFEYELKKQ